MNHQINPKRILLLLVLISIQIVGIQFGFAEIKLPAIVSSNMVLQRNTTIKLWGWADANEKIEIKTSWLEKANTIIADKNGNWELEIQTTNSKENQTIKLISSASNIVLNNILFGEVWLCSGQSNMQQNLNGYNGQPTFGSLEAIISLKNNNIRLFTVERNASKTPLNDFEKNTTWEEASIGNVGKFSAVAYFFGKQLQEILDVPIGLIHSSYGGSKIEAWMSKEVLEEHYKTELNNIEISDKLQFQPTVLYNAMIHPLINYNIKGVIWYQGEGNRFEPEEYKKLFPAMVKDWRKLFKLGDFPFYYSQIAPFGYEKNAPIESRNNTAFIREVQLECLKLIPNSGIAITLDIGEEFYIHPPKKKEVADRLLYNALYSTYGFKNVEFLTPIYESFKIENSTIELSFTNSEKGLYAFDDLFGFEIAGEDKIFYPAKATIMNTGKRNKIFVENTNVKKPIAVRYAWRNWTKASLFSTNLLPVSSFRTDNWEK